jgi:hypothetical protein
MSGHAGASDRSTPDGAQYPLEYRLLDEQLADFYREFPRYDPKTGFTTDPGT